MSIAAFNLVQFDSTVCVVVGLGLIGRATANSLRLFGTGIDINIAKNLNWSNSDSIIRAIHLATRGGKWRLELIWCAGRSGFSAIDCELDAEYQVFTGVIDYLVGNYKHLAVSFMSSAGGLYENTGGTQGLLDPVSPVRPYGKWKLKQEQMLRERVEVSRIYRIASVYGVTPKKSRLGIVNALIESTYTNKSALIYAQPSTLRDYVSNLDVGKHVASQVGNNTSTVELIASGRPTSINMLANLIKRVSRRNPKISFRPDIDNDKDIVFAQKSLAPGFQSSSLEEGILKLSFMYRSIKFG